MDIDINPESSINNQIWFSDKNNNLYATLQANQTTNGTVSFLLTMKSKSTNSYTTLGISQSADGTSYTTAPTPLVSDNSTKISTTAYINTKFQKVSALPASPDADTFYFIP